MGHLAALPFPRPPRGLRRGPGRLLPWQRCRQARSRAGAGGRGSRLPGGAGRGAGGHACACGCRVEGEAGSRHQRFDLPQPFSAAGFGAPPAAGEEWARCPLPPGLVSKPPPRPRAASVSGWESCSLPWARCGARGSAPPLPHPRGCTEGARPQAGPGPGGAPPRPPGVRALAGRRPFPLDLSLGVTKAPFYFQCHFGVCLLFPATSRFQGYGRLPAGSGRGERLQRYLI